MNLREAINTDVSSLGNVNVTVWAIPSGKAGSQARFDLDCEAHIALLPPSQEYKKVWELDTINYYRGRGQSEQEILDTVHSFYRVPLGMTNPF